MLPPVKICVIGYAAASGTRAVLLLLSELNVPFVCVRVGITHW
jgi:hypothetical protein